MKKHVLTPPSELTDRDLVWLPLEDLADVEITSESTAHPIEQAFTRGAADGWRADGPGPQTIRLRFNAPLSVRRIRVVFEEHERARTQEFVMLAQMAGGEPAREIVRQQFNFSPTGARREQEDYQVRLTDVVAIELTIIPDLNGGEARASLRELRVAS